MSAKFILEKLPYDYQALEPYISATTLKIHHGAHHQTYLDNLNKEIALDNELSLEEIIKKSYTEKNNKVFNNAGQVWNHNFYWNSITPNYKEPKGKIREQLEKDFSSYQNFQDMFITLSLQRFGSGWSWLVFDEEEQKLKITTTMNAEMPMISMQKALLTCDVWEHAYYIDYQNRRLEYLEKFLKYLINWDFASLNFLQKN